MATVLAYTSPAIGHLFPMTPLLLELRDRGHTVHLRTLSSQVEQMRALGFHTEPIDPRIEEIQHDDYKAKNSVESLTLSSRVFTERGSFDSPDFRQAVDRVRPDVAIVDALTWGAAARAEALGGPWVSFEPTIPALDCRGTPPFGPGLAPMRGPLGAIRDAAVRRAVLGVVEKGVLGPVNSIRSQVGLAPVASADELFRTAPLLLVTTSKPFEYAATEWGPDVIMMGACAWEPPSEPPDWLEHIDRPIVLVTSSSEFQDDAILIRTALTALADEPVHVVATMPAGLTDDLEVPSNATVVEFVPHGPVLGRAAVAVTHGGMGATQKALSHGVPVCVVPFGRDQLEVARRVEVSDSGTRLPAKRLSPARLKAAVTSAMTKAPGARRVAGGYAASGGPATGADAVEGLLRG